MSIVALAPSLTTAELATASEVAQLIVLAHGRVTPSGKTVRNEAPAPLTTVTLTAIAVLSAGTDAATDSFTVSAGCRVWMGLAGSRVSRTRTGTTDTNAADDDESVGAAEAM